MSTGRVSSHKSKHSRSRSSRGSNTIPPQPTLTPENAEREFEPCAATSSYFLYAHRNIVLCLHHDTLAIERRFDRHREDVRWIAADTVSERGAGRLAVSYDAGHTAIVWDIATGDEISRFAAYEEIRVATWMRNGNIAFGNVQGNVILFEPSTSEHISARTIYDPITAIAPGSDSRTFAIGYLNGSILIATLQPFTMVHSLNTSSAPSRITGLAWHGSASRQKSDMLATQTADGNLKVWSIPKVVNGVDSPNIIRVLNRPDGKEPGPCWFAWSKLGRIIHHSGGETRAWDVRTKNVTCEPIPTLDGIIGIANCGPTSTLFTLGSNHTVHQYDINPGEKPIKIASVRHAPAATPPSPPNSIEEQKDQQEEDGEPPLTLASVPIVFSDAETSEEEGPTMSPLQRIAKEMDQLDDERRDHVGPLSPVSSRASSVTSSRSSDGGRRAPSYRYDKAPSSRASNASANEGTEFSFGPSIRQPQRESISVRSTSSHASSKYRSSGLRKEVLRSPDAASQGSVVEIFPCVRARLVNVPFRTPHYGAMARTPDVLRREMLSVVFGWNDDVELLIRDELARHLPASTGGVLLAQWLGELGADSMASMVGSESMTSADWMLLALSTMGHASQRKVGEAFVHRLLEKGDIHPAVAILLGLGEENDAIEVYVSRGHYMEAVLLTCLVFPADWKRQSYLVRKWGEVLVAQGQPELAVRCFSCTSVDISEPWFSPRAQDSVFTAQSEYMSKGSASSPPTSPPSAGGPGRFRNASLKLITTFGDDGPPVLPISSAVGVGVTPIAESALSPGAPAPWAKSSQKKERDPSSARTATPGGYARRRLPSESAERRNRTPAETPLTAQRDFAMSQGSDRSGSARVRRTPSVNSSEASQYLEPSSARRPSGSERVPSPAQDAFVRREDEHRPGNRSRERHPVELQVQVIDTAYLGQAVSPAKAAMARAASIRSDGVTHGGVESMGFADHRRNESRQREPSEDRGRPGMRYIRPSAASPTSPVPMSSVEVAAATRAMAERAATLQQEQHAPRASSRAGSRDPSQRWKHSGDGVSQQNASASDGPTSPYRQERKETSSIDIRSRSSSRQPPMQKLSKSRIASPLQPQISIVQAGPATGEISDESFEDSDRGRTTGPRDQMSLARKRLAARELEERRASLARRPSAPVIPLPGESPLRRPHMAPRFHTELGDSPHTFLPPISAGLHGRSHTADPHDIQRSAPKMRSGSESSTPIGLPSNPRAMRIAEQNAKGMASGDQDTTNKAHSAFSSPQHQQHANSGFDDVVTLLPSTVFTDPSSPQRAASAPLERHTADTTHHPTTTFLPASSFSPTKQRRPSASSSISRSGRSNNPPHSRHPSQSENTIVHLPTSPLQIRTSIDETLCGTSPNHHQIIFVNNNNNNNDIHLDDPHDDLVVPLPELLHLATPPPPPPLPPPFTLLSATDRSSLGVIDIAIEEDTASGSHSAILPSSSSSYFSLFPQHPSYSNIDNNNSSGVNERNTTLPHPDRAATTSPTIMHKTGGGVSHGPLASSGHHRRGRNSVSEGIGSRFRNRVAESMKSSSSRSGGGGGGVSSGAAVISSPVGSGGVSLPVGAGAAGGVSSSVGAGAGGGGVAPYESVTVPRSVVVAAERDGYREGGGGQQREGDGGGHGHGRAKSNVPPPPPPPPPPGDMILRQVVYQPDNNMI